MFDDLKPEDLAWLILLLPLLSAVAIGLFTHRSHRLSAQISITAVVLSFLVSCGMFAMFKSSPLVLPSPLNWLNLGDLKVEIGLRLDPLSLLILLVVTGMQFITFGLLGEMLARTYHESQGKPIYVIRDLLA